jgi:hypothetical protein
LNAAYHQSEQALIQQKKQEIKMKADAFLHGLGDKRCKVCTLPRPCRHHERELYRAGLSEDTLEKELQRDEKSPKRARETQHDFELKQDSLMMNS